jgi:flagellar P-ring protein precursor FlgI
MTPTLRAALLAVLLTAFAAPNAGATSRIKDLANIEGVRQNQLIGYGLVVGLNGTGDTLNNIPFTKQSLTAMLERLGVNIRGQTLRTGNVAAVMVTANLPPFGTQGTRIDVTVSALGDSKSLQGGVLLVTPLLGADGNVYAVGQGSVAIGGFQAEGDAAKIVRGVPTVGRISNGALIEREIEFNLNKQNQLRMALRNPDFTTAKRIAAAINARPRHRRHHHSAAIPRQRDLAADRSRTAPGRAGSRRQDRHRRALRHHRHGPRCARLHGRGGAGQSHRHHYRNAASQPADTLLARRHNDGRAAHPDRRAGGRQEARAGQGWRVGPRDLIAILQAIKAAGAIQADIEVM